MRMKRNLLLISIVLLVSFVASGQSVSPDDGHVTNGVYHNNYFGFSVKYPQGWVVHGDATNTHLREIGKERATSTGALSAASTEVILKNTYQLLTTFQYPLGTPDVDLNPAFMVVAENVSHAPGIVTGRDYLLNTRALMIKTGVVPVQDEPLELTLAGRKFFRQDAIIEMKGVTVRQAILISVNKGFALAFILSGRDAQAIDEMVSSFNTIKFSVPVPAATQPKPAPSSRRKPRGRN